MAGYFSVSDRGEWGHWDIADKVGLRVFRIRGDDDAGFTLCDERRPARHPLRNVPFATPFEALEYAARQIMAAEPSR